MFGGESPSCVVANVPGRNIIVSSFELQCYYYVHLQTINVKEKIVSD